MAKVTETNDGALSAEELADVEGLVAERLLADPGLHREHVLYEVLQLPASKLRRELGEMLSRRRLAEIEYHEARLQALRDGARAETAAEGHEREVARLRAEYAARVAEFEQQLVGERADAAAALDRLRAELLAVETAARQERIALVGEHEGRIAAIEQERARAMETARQFGAIVVGAGRELEALVGQLKAAAAKVSAA